MKAKIKYANYTKGEYKTVDISTNKDVIDLIKAFPWEQELEIIDGIVGFKGSPGITIQKPLGDSITINCFRHNDMLLYNIDLSYRKYFFWDQIFSVRNTFDDLLELVVYFIENESFMLHNRIKHGRHFILPAYMRYSLSQGSSKSEKIIILESGAYKKFKFSFKKSILPLTFLVIFILLSLFVVSVMHEVPAIIFIVFIPYLIVFPPILIFYNHYKHFKSAAVIFKLNDNRFSFFKDSIHEVYDKSQIADIHKIISKTGKESPWSEIFLWRVSFKDGKHIFISNLMMSQSNILSEFGISSFKTKATHFLPLAK